MQVSNVFLCRVHSEFKEESALASRPCQHEDCGRQSHTGFWCQGCIEQEWPDTPLGDGRHWIVWKGVFAAADTPDAFTGALNCPYRLGQVITPLRNGSWLLSPLGAIKEGYGTHILAALVSAQWCRISPRLILSSGAPALSLGAFARSELPSPEQSSHWLSAVNEHLEEIETFETLMRAQVEPQIDLLSEQITHLKSAEKRFEADYAIRLREEMSSIQEMLQIENLRERMHEVLGQLDERQQEILKLRYGLEDGHPCSYWDIVAFFDVTRERVRQIEQKALERLKQSGRKR